MKRHGYFLTQLLLTAFAVALPLLAVQIYQLYHQKALDEAATVGILKVRTEVAAQRVDAIFTRVENMVHLVQERPEIQSLDPASCGRTLRGMAAIDPALANVGAVDLQGNLLCLSETPNAPRRNYADAPWFAGALEKAQGHNLYVSRPYFTDVTKKYALNIVAPLHDMKGKRIGLLAVAVDLGFIADRILSLDGMPAGSVVAVTDANGYVLARQPDMPLFFNTKISEATIARARRVAGNEVETFALPNLFGHPAEYAATRLRHYGLYLGATTTVAAVSQKATSDLEHSVEAAVVAALLALLTAIYGSNRLTGPLRSLARSARALGSGDSNARADENLPGEFHEVAREFNTMVAARHAAELSRQAQAEAEAANQAKSAFLAHMSHEIRTPMNAIIGLTNLALRTDLTPRQQDYLTKTKVAADSLLELIDQILDLSKIEAGKLELELREFALDDVLSRVTVIAGQKAQQKGLELLIGVPVDVPQRLLGDDQRLTQVLVNLCNNAVKFTASGEVVIRVSVVKSEERAAVLKFSVRDSGIGISPEERERLFKPFSQADASTSRWYGGTGLGLAICKQLVELMGGSIDVASEPGKGAEFFFTVPFGLPPDSVRGAGLDLRGLNTLVVDDSPSACEVLGGLLESLHCDVQTAATGRDSIAALERAVSEGKPFDIVLLDYTLPDLDGFEVAERIRTHPVLGRQPLVIMVTAHSDEAIAHRAKAVGLDGYLSKPVTASTLLDAIGTALGRARGVAKVQKDGREDAEVVALLRGRHVLLVEDNEFNQLVASELLSLMAGMRVTVAASGAQALAALQGHAVDVVLMDIQMPQMDGYETTRRIRADAQFAGLPIIAMTAHATDRDRELCLAAGMNDYITKPFEPQALLAVLARWLAGTRGITATEHVVHPRSGVSFELGLRRCLNKPELFDKIVRRYVSERSELVAEIRAAIEAGDPERASGLSHSLVSTAGTIGAVGLSEAARALELAITLAETERWPRLLDALEAEGRIVLDVLRGYLEHRGPPGSESGATTSGPDAAADPS